MSVVKVLVCTKCGATSVERDDDNRPPAGVWWSRARCPGGHRPVEYVPKEDV